VERFHLDLCMHVLWVFLKVVGHHGVVVVVGPCIPHCPTASTITYLCISHRFYESFWKLRAFQNVSQTCRTDRAIYWYFLHTSVLPLTVALTWLGPTNWLNCLVFEWYWNIGLNDTLCTDCHTIRDSSNQN
jgi:hypothetical protein